EAQEGAAESARRELARGGITNKRERAPYLKHRRIANLSHPLECGRGPWQRDTWPEVEMMRGVSDRKRPQKMGSNRIDHGGTSNLHDQANATLSNPILLWRGRKRERLDDALVSTELRKEAGRELTTPVRVQMQDWKVPPEPLAQLVTSVKIPTTRP
ncbi:unnamed protein product, partial [Closterium sp. NIES-54]